MEPEKLPLSDEEIASKVQSGDAEAFGVLVDRYMEKLRRYGKKFLLEKEDIKDLVQDIFLKAYQNIRGFDPALKFSPWIYRIAHNVFIDTLRKESKSPIVFVDFDTFLAHPKYHDPEHSASDVRQMREVLDQDLAKIDSKYREVLVLYYLEDIPYKEIADILSVPVSTVAIRLKRAKKALEKVLTKNDYGK